MIDVKMVVFPGYFDFDLGSGFFLFPDRDGIVENGNDGDVDVHLKENDGDDHKKENVDENDHMKENGVDFDYDDAHQRGNDDETGHNRDHDFDFGYYDLLNGNEIVDGIDSTVNENVNDGDENDDRGIDHEMMNDDDGDYCGMKITMILILR